jgi:hypothetical protein
MRKRPAPGAPEAEAPPQQASVPELARELVAARLAEAEALRRLRCAAEPLPSRLPHPAHTHNCLNGLAAN